jgi:hypothetical protein
MRLYLLALCLPACVLISDQEYAWRAGKGDLAEGIVPGTDGAGDCTDPFTFWLDADLDGFGDPTEARQACEIPDGYANNANDCDDSDPTAGELVEWFVDADEDGYGGEATLAACHQPEGYVDNALDCDDGNTARTPGLTEICDRIDNDCDELTDDLDEDLDLTTAIIWYLDADSDRFGDPDTTVLACEQPIGAVSNALDCNDGEALAWTTASEVCEDGIDNNCDGSWEECLLVGTETITIAELVLYSGLAGDLTTIEIGDISGDGAPDLLIAAPNYPVDGQPTGKVASFTAGPTLGGLLDTFADPDLLISAANPRDRFGWSLAAGGDLTGDLFHDLAVGALYESSVIDDAGGVWVFPGPTLGALDTSAGVLISGAAVGSRTGASLAWAGDATADGPADLLIGAYLHTAAGSARGAAFLLAGPLTTNRSTTEAVLTIVGTNAGDRAGYALSASVDFDGDGLGELVVAADRSDLAATDTGSVAVFSPELRGIVDFGEGEALIHGTTVEGGFGSALRAVGDLNGDGLSELAIGAPREAGGGGAVHIFQAPFSGTTDTSTAYLRVEADGVSDRLGESLNKVGDFDGDGSTDLGLGAPGAASTGGLAALFYGPLPTGVVPLSAADFMVLGSSSGGEGEAVGSSFAQSDLNLDGFPDLLVGGGSRGRAWSIAGGGL